LRPAKNQRGGIFIFSINFYLRLAKLRFGENVGGLFMAGSFAEYPQISQDEFI
jgi:hypothetical protein